MCRKNGPKFQSFVFLFAKQNKNTKTDKIGFFCDKIRPKENKFKNN